MSLHRNLRNIILLILAIVAVLYTVYASRNIILGPQLVIYEPVDGAIISTSTVVIRGFVPRAKSVTLNDQAIAVDESGNFAEIRLLEPGHNVYKLLITDRFERKNQKILSIYRQVIF